MPCFVGASDIQFESFSSSRIVGIHDWLLNPIDRVTHEFQKVEIQALNHQMIVREASEQINWPGTSKLFVSNPSPAESSERTDFLDSGKASKSCEKIGQTFL
jgi:hypothetical protein